MLRLNISLVVVLTVAGCAKETPRSPPAAPPRASLTASKDMTAPNSETAQLIDELPARSSGTETAEAAAKRFFEAAARGDRAAMQDVLISLSDLQAMVIGDEFIHKGKLGLANVLRKAKALMPGTLKVGVFEAGALQTLEPGQRGFRNAISYMRDARLNLTRDGQPLLLRLDAIAKIGERWKLGWW
jgi:hypothetical protein